MTTTPRKGRTGAKSPAKPAAAANQSDAKAGAKKPAAGKPAAAKPTGKSPTAKPHDAKAADSKASAAKPAETAKAEPPKPETAKTEPPKAEPKPAAAPSTPAPPPPAAAPRSFDPGTVRLISWVALVLAMVAVVGAVTSPWWAGRFAAVMPFAENVGEDPAVAALVGRVQALEEKAQSLETDKSEALATLESERKRFKEQLSGVMKRLHEVEQSMQDARDLMKASDSAARAMKANQSLKELSDRLSQLEEGGGQVDTLLQRLDKVEGVSEAGAKQSAEAEAKLSSALRKVTDRVQALEQAGPAASARETSARAVILAVAQLRDAIRRGDPFKAQLDALKAVAGDDKTIAGSVVILAKHAADGVPTLAVLHDRYTALAGAIVAADRADSGKGWFRKAKEKLFSLVRIRRLGGRAEPDTVDALVDRAEKLLAAGDLKGALERLGQLTGAAADKAAPWVAQARARLETERALAGLHVYAVSLLGPSPAPAAAEPAAAEPAAAEPAPVKPAPVKPAPVKPAGAGQ